jgi:hypothetical protein
MATAPNAGVPLGARRKAEDADEPKTLYVHRKLTNAAEFLKWAAAAGFAKTLPADDIHVTTAFSKTPVAWLAAPTGEPSTSVKPTSDGRAIERLGDKGAVALRFESAALSKRWREFKAAGASWDYPQYKPHVTITYDAGELDIDAIEPYAGPLEFGPEIFAEIDPDWATKAKASLVGTDSAMRLALDREQSNRTIDAEGRMRVAKANICKACISPYRGEEIPGWEEIGLEKDKIYQLLRPAAELKKAAASSNGIQLLRNHIPVDADDHQPWEVAGSVGTNAKWEDPYVTNSLTIWVARDIEGIESGEKVELSPGYHYEPDMTPGEFEGEHFDGSMTNVVFNHLALVEQGRQGKDIVVGDSVENMQWNAIARALLEMVDA